MAEDSRGRVLHVLGPSTGGIRRHVAALSDGLLSRGWSVEVAGPAGVMEGIGPQQEVVPVPDGVSLMATWRARQALAALAPRFDVVHAHGLKAGWVAASIRKLSPLVVTLHNVVLEEAAGSHARLLRALERALPARADAVIAVSAEIARRFVGRPGGSRLVVIPPIGPPVVPCRTPEDVRTDLGVAPGEALVVSGTARLHPQKDLTTLLRAFAIVHRAHPDARLAVVGEGPQRAELEALRDQLGLSSRVRFTGWVTNFADLLRAADVVAMSSLWEGSSIALTEAMRLARPVVATAVGATPEVVVDGETGRLVPPGSPERLAAALGDLLEDPETARQLGDAGRRRVEERFAPDLLVSAVEDVYRATLDR